MADSRTVVQALHEVDPGFRELCDTIFGKAVDVDLVHDALYTPHGVDLIEKSMPGPSDVHVMGALRPTGRSRRSSSRRGVLKKAAQKAYAAEVEELEKGDGVTVTWTGEFSKTDEDKRQVFGWASVVQLNGQPVVDRQGDLITPDELEKAAYSYVHKSRVGGHQHKRSTGEDGSDTPFHASDMIESLVLTPEKIEKMGFPPSTPVGWWVGYKVHDDETWDKVKKGELTGFSIHGRGRRIPVDH